MVVDATRLDRTVAVHAISPRRNMKRVMSPPRPLPGNPQHSNSVIRGYTDQNRDDMLIADR